MVTGLSVDESVSAEHLLDGIRFAAGAQPIRNAVFLDEDLLSLVGDDGIVEAEFFLTTGHMRGERISTVLMRQKA